jgi:NAD(P)-dependent dehydrogenase (short-subunit alcohol dehydrogenase family)
MPDPGTPQTVLITGASSGIGRATAVELARRGAQLVLVARGDEPLADTAGEAHAAGAAAAIVCPADVLDEDAFRAAVETAVDRFGRLDAVIHAAQVMAYGTIEQLPRKVFERVVETAVHGTASVARVVLPVFRKQGAGHLVVVNSLLGNVAAPLMGSYVAAKWGQLGLVRVLQMEVRDAPGVSVSAVQPGGVNTPIYFQGASWTGSTGRPPPPVYSPQRVVHPADHRRLPSAPGGLRLPGGAPAPAHGDRRRRRAADRGQRLRVPARRQRHRGALAEQLRPV